MFRAHKLLIYGRSNSESSSEVNFDLQSTEKLLSCFYNLINLIFSKH